MSVSVCLGAIIPLAVRAQEPEAPLGTAFTYQGRLTQNGQLVPGPTVNLVFRLFDVPTGGTALFTHNVGDWPIDDGLLTVPIDFGSTAFTGEQRWLEAVVNGQTLSPRQELKPAPYALFAAGGAGGGGYWSASGNDIYNNNTGNVRMYGLVGIGTGTATPGARLEVAGTGTNALEGLFSDSTLHPTQPPPMAVAGVQVKATAQQGFGSFLARGSLRVESDIGSSTRKLALHAEDANMPIAFESVDVERMRIVADGSVGIGTNDPQSPLHLHSAGSNVALRMTAGGSWPLIFKQYNNSDFAIENGGAERMRLGANDLGIGNNNPSWPLDVSGRVRVRGAGNSGGGMWMSRPSAPTTNVSFVGRGSDTELWTGVHSNTSGSWNMVVLDTGNVGIGTTSPTAAKPDVIGLNDAGRFTSASTSGTGVFGYASAAGTGTTFGVYGQSNSTAGRGVSGYAFAATGTTYGGEFITNSPYGTGVVGVVNNTAASGGSAGVRGRNMGTGALGVGVWGSHAGGGWGVYGQSPSGIAVQAGTESGYAVNGVANGNTGANYGVVGSTNSPDGFGGYFNNYGGGVALYVNGTCQVKVLEILGADVAEKFPVSEKVAAGMVVAIDPDHPGEMCLARGAYNRRVAGVVSGAGDVPTGAILGNLPGCEDAPPIALSGRVWVHCDTTGGAIQPGDLPTTADAPGHAMKVTDYVRAQGAIIGEAMTHLGESEKGLVLVLVNLQ